MTKTGKLYLIPNTLGGESVVDIIPAEVIKIATSLRFFAVEEIKSARRLLRKMDREFPIDESTFYQINKTTKESDLMEMLLTLTKGENLGIISEAGCAGIADPGADLVFLAHSQKIEVVPMVGASSILLALIGSGFSGQHFTFHGYLPRERKDRIRKMKDMEMDTRRKGATHIFMDTPFRSMHVLEDLLNECADSTQLCIAANLTTVNQRIQTMSVVDWREHAFDITKIPVIFLIGTGQ
jgi:16S rRNA (cytidine1402-2'-O)-methyltransferase